MLRARSLIALLLVVTSFSTLAVAPDFARLPNQPINEFPSVLDALKGLLGRRNAKIELHAGWTIITEHSGLIWTFVPIDHPGYPSVMRQRVSYQPDGGVVVDMAVLCQTRKVPCTQIIDEYRTRNQQTAQQLAQLAVQQAMAAEENQLQARR